MSDYPDFYSIYKAVFGPPINLAGSANTSAIETKELVTVTGRGETVGGYMTSFLSVAQSGDKPILIVDGVTIADDHFGLMLALGLTFNANQPFVLTKYADSDFLYSAMLKPGITFKTSISMKFYNSTGAAKSIAWRLQYIEL